MNDQSYSADQPERAQAAIDLATLTDHVIRIDSDFIDLNNRLDASAEEMAAVKAAIAAMDRGQIKIIGQIDENTALTSEILAIFSSLKEAFRVFEFVGRAAKPLAVIAGLIGSVVGAWLAIKNAWGGK